jgi:hypothetical protein
MTVLIAVLLGFIALELWEIVRLLRQIAGNTANGTYKLVGIRSRPKQPGSPLAPSA